MPEADEDIDGPAIVELLGHRRTAGRVRAVRVAGAGMLRIDIPDTDQEPARTEYVGAGSVYALHPVDEAAMRHAVARLAAFPGSSPVAALTAAPWHPAPLGPGPGSDKFEFFTDVVDAHVCEDDQCDHRQEDDRPGQEDPMPYVSGDLADR